MRFFHLSDLHLGKTFHGYDLLDDQSYILDRVVDEIRAAKPDALIVAGDVYDRAVPPVEAIRLFDDFLRAAREAAPGIGIVVVPGNHDSAGRLSFGASLLADSGLCIATRAEGKPALEKGEGRERAAVWALPFLTQASAPWDELDAAMGPEGDGAEGGMTGGAEGEGADGEGAVAGQPPERKPAARSQQELLRLAVASIRRAMVPDAANVLVAHCFAAGASVTESELSFVGAVNQVDCSLFDGFDYVALGHLHSCQSPAPRVWYCGAPLAYSAGEAGTTKEFLSVEVRAGESPRIERVALAPKRRVRKLAGFFRELLANPLPEAERDDYIEVRLLDEEPVIEAYGRLKSLYPRLLGIASDAFERRWVAADIGDVGGDAERLRRRGGGGPGNVETAKEDFVAFYREMTGEPPAESMAALFESMAREAADASH